MGSTSVQGLLENHCDEDHELAREIDLEHRRELFFQAAAIVRTEVATDTWQVFPLAVIEGVPIDEVAAKVNKSVGAAYAARGRVMSRMRRLVEDLEQRES